MNKRKEEQPIYCVSYVATYTESECRDPSVERDFENAAVIIFADDGTAYLGFIDEKDRPKK